MKLRKSIQSALLVGLVVWTSDIAGAQREKPQENSALGQLESAQEATAQKPAGTVKPPAIDPAPVSLPPDTKTRNQQCNAGEVKAYHKVIHAIVRCGVWNKFWGLGSLGYNAECVDSRISTALAILEARFGKDDVIYAALDSAKNNCERRRVHDAYGYRGDGIDQRCIKGAVDTAEAILDSRSTARTSP